MVKKIIEKLSKKKNIFVGTGISEKDDPAEAGREAIEMAMKNSKAEKPDFALVFASAKAHGTKEKMQIVTNTVETYLRGLNPNVNWLGASSKKEISNYGYTEGTVVAMVISSQYIHFGVGVGKGAAKTPEKAGALSAKDAISKVKLDSYLDPYLHFTAIKTKQIGEILRMKPYLFMTISPGVTKTYLPQDSKILKGITNVVGAHPLFGGAAADDWTLTQTYTMANGELNMDAVVSACIVSNLKFGVGVKHGYDRTNNVLLVTKSKGGIVHEFNNRPAAQVYSELSGVPMEELKKNLVPALARNPLGVPDTQGEYWLNFPYAVGKNDSLLFYEPVYEGTALFLMKANNKEIVGAAKTAIRIATDGLQEIEGLIVMSCSARLIALGEDIQKEYKLIKQVTKNKPFIGFSCYAEMATIPSGSVQKHAYTFVTLGMTNRLISQ